LIKGLVEIHADAGAGFRIELQGELLAGGGEDRRFDDATLEDDDFAGAGVDRGRKAGAVPGFGH
jgi:hypothetical protein